MSITLEELVLRLETAGTSQVVNDLKRVKREVTDMGNKSRQSSGNTGAMEGSLGDLNKSAVKAGIGMGILKKSYGALAGGVSMAAKFESIQKGFETIIGDADKAKKLVGDLRSMGADTNYRTDDMIEFAGRLLNVGESAEQVTDKLHTMATVGHMTHMSLGKVGEMVDKMADLRASDFGNKQTFEGLGKHINIAEVVNAGTKGTKGATNFQGENAQAFASQYLSKMRGVKAYELIMKGMKIRYPDDGVRDFNTLLQNIDESLDNIMTPTGELLLPTLKGVATGVLTVTNAMGEFNKMTGGKAGLAVGIGGLALGARLAIPAFFNTVDRVRELTTAVLQLAEAATVATKNTRQAAGQNAAESLLGDVGIGGKGKFNPNARTSMRPYGSLGNAAKIGGLKGIGRFAKSFLPTGVKALPMLGKGLLKGVGKLLGGPVGWVGMGMEGLGSIVPGKAGKYLSGIGSGVSTGAMIGGIAGSIIPGLGTVVGEVAGGIIGGIVGGIGTHRSLGANPVGGKTGEKDNTQKEIAKNTAKTADYMEELHTHLVGGGKNAGRASRSLEAEISLARMFAFDGNG